MTSMVIPIDEQITEVVILPARGDVLKGQNVIKGQNWRPDLGYQLREEVGIGAAKHDITFLLVQVAKQQEATKAQ
jgi:hypothetical protein